MLASVVIERSYRERRRQALRAECHEFFLRMTESHRKLSESYAARAETLCEESSS